MPSIVATPVQPTSHYDIFINQDETFDLPLAIVYPDEAGIDTPYDFTHAGAVAAPNLAMTIRPAFDHSTLIKKLTSPAGGLGGVILDDAAAGSISFFMEQAAVAAELTVTLSASGRQVVYWEWWLEEIIGARVIEHFRGRFTVNPGRRA